MNNDYSTLVWHEFTPLPSSVKLHYTNPTGCNNLTPSIIRERYANLISNSAIVVWKSTHDGMFGLRAGIDEVAWTLDDIEHIYLCIERPAKGGGHLMVNIRLTDNSVQPLIYSSNYSDDLLAWFRPLCQLIGQVIPVEMSEIEMSDT